MSNKRLIIFFTLLIYIPLLSSTQLIHVFGDSHASFCFSNNKFLAFTEYSFFNYFHNNAQVFLPFVISAYISKTMHGVSSKGLDLINIKNSWVQENDIVIFAFGEVDVRAHIGRQRDEKKRDLSEIIDTLVTKYFKFIKANKQQFNNIYCVVMSVVPPSDTCVDPSMPFYGTLEDRVNITKMLNQKLQNVCRQEKFEFLDVYSLFANEKGFLIYQLSDGCMHINMLHNTIIKNKLIELLQSKNIIQALKKS